MFCLGDMVMHPTAGVCRIDSITEENFSGAPQKYYVLKTVYDSSPTVIHLPVEGRRIKLRKLLSKGDITEIIHSVSINSKLWDDDNVKRKETFAKILEEGNHAELLQMICEIHIKRIEKENSGKKLYVADNKVLQAAEKIIHQEFAHTLNIAPDNVADFIMSELKVG